MFSSMYCCGNGEWMGNLVKGVERMIKMKREKDG
jgi:hypothetical protein